MWPRCRDPSWAPSAALQSMATCFRASLVDSSLCASVSQPLTGKGCFP